MLREAPTAAGGGLIVHVVHTVLVWPSRQRGEHYMQDVRVRLRIDESWTCDSPVNSRTVGKVTGSRSFLRRGSQAACLRMQGSRLERHKKAVSTRPVPSLYAHNGCET